MTIALNRHPETQILIDLLRAVPLGGEVGYRALSDAIGRDVRSHAAARLQSAKRIALRDHGAAFFTEPRVGLRRIRPEELAQVGANARRKVRAATRTGLQTITKVAAATNGADPATQRRIAAEHSSLSLLNEIAQEPRQVAFETSSGGAPMPPALAGQAFLRHIGALPGASDQSAA